jgi:hypothetical protein
VARKKRLSPEIFVTDTSSVCYAHFRDEKKSEEIRRKQKKAEEIRRKQPQIGM